jgi:hypothetical protein
MEHFLTGFFCRKKDFWHIQSCRGENSNLAEFAQMRQKRMGIGAIKTSFGGIGPMCQKGRFYEAVDQRAIEHPAIVRKQGSKLMSEPSLYLFTHELSIETNPTMVSRPLG